MKVIHNENFKKIFSFFIISIFILFIFNYYQNQKEDFSYLNKISIYNVITIVIFCFFYLITETFILKI